MLSIPESGIWIAGLARRMTPETSPAPPSQLPCWRSSPKAAEPERLPGSDVSCTQFVPGQPAKTPSLVRVQPASPSSKSSSKNATAFFCAAQEVGGFCLSIGWKLHCAVGSVRNSTAAIIAVTDAQSVDVIDSPETPVAVLLVPRSLSG